MESRKKERSLMDLEEFEEYLADNRTYKSFEAVGKFKSIKRAVKRGLVSVSGIVLPKRPFSNKANTSKRKGVHSRKNNELKKRFYADMRRY